MSFENRVKGCDSSIWGWDSSQNTTPLTVHCLLHTVMNKLPGTVFHSQVKENTGNSSVPFTVTLISLPMFVC